MEQSYSSATSLFICKMTSHLGLRPKNQARIFEKVTLRKSCKGPRSLSTWARSNAPSHALRRNSAIALGGRSLASAPALCASPITSAISSDHSPNATATCSRIRGLWLDNSQAKLPSRHPDQDSALSARSVALSKYFRNLVSGAPFVCRRARSAFHISLVSRYLTTAAAPSASLLSKWL